MPTKVVGTVEKVKYVRGAFSICQFRTEEEVFFPDKSKGVRFSIKGECLPSEGATIEACGSWDKPYETESGKNFWTLSVDSFEEVRVREKEAIIKWLLSLDGVGKHTANRIFNKFGLETYDILDKDINRLQEVQGIGKGKKFREIKKQYILRTSARDLFSYLAKFRVPRARITALYEAYGTSALEKVKEEPYSLYLSRFFSFEAAESIARDNGHDPICQSRLEACVFRTMRDAEAAGNTCISWKMLLTATLKALNVHESREVQIEIGKLIRDVTKKLGYSILSIERDNEETYFYLKNTADAEKNTAAYVRQMLKSSTTKDFSKDIARAEKKLGARLSSEQEDAINMICNNRLCVVTGGPGTGKTTFQKVMFEVWLKNNPRKKVILCAPTGKAAQRMSEQSGLPAKTLHRTLGLRATDNGEFIQGKGDDLSNALIVCDESSMLDIFIAEKFLEAVPESSSVVFIGDIHQLPSVGAGAVLKDMIDAGPIPVVTFTKIFRQAEGSIIAGNAGKINNGKKDLQFGDAFKFFEEPGEHEIVEEVRSLYKEAVDKYGEDNVIVLTPYRKKTATGVNELNPVLRKAIHPDIDESMKVKGRDLYLGDKVMFTKNVGDLTNGDTGHIIRISEVEGLETVLVDFEGREEILAGEEILNLVPAFATTVHKSQGSEYPCCIVIVDPQHKVLLKRNLLYTAITRSKESVLLVGQKKTMLQAIDRPDTGIRHTRLASLIGE